MTAAKTKPLFPYFGGKRRAAAQVWAALGPVKRYIEPFFGSGAVLLRNPHPLPLSELVNDKDHHIANLWRALQVDPDEVLRMASAPCSEVELRARHKWLEAWTPPDFDDPQACDPTMAGVWLWRACVSIGHTARLHRGNHGKGVKAATWNPTDFAAVVKRISRIQVMCGDWSRCVTPSALRGACWIDGGHAIFLDPPYGTGNGVAYDDGTGTVAHDVWQWACENGDNPRLRIVVAGYEDGRELPPGWWAIERAEKGGYANRGANANRKRERLWCSPHCLRESTLL